MPCARNAIQNITTRAPMDPHWWVNDPDCLLVRADSKLTLAEVQSLASAISLSGGAILLSDDMSKLDEDRLRLAQSLMPVLPPAPQVPDLFQKTMPAKLRQTLQTPAGTRHILALFNWADKPRDLTLEPRAFGLEAGPWLMREFWTGEWSEIDSDYAIKSVPAHGVRLVALCPRQDVSYLGSALHLSQGIELQSWHVDERMLTFELDLGREAEGNVYLFCRATPKSVTADGNEIYWIQEEKNLINIPLKFTGTTKVEVLFS